jgi:hypothetical protein
MIFKIFSQKIGEKIGVFYAKNCRKSQKIVITTSTPGVDVKIFKNIFAKKLAHSWQCSPKIMTLLLSAKK